MGMCAEQDGQKESRLSVWAGPRWEGRVNRLLLIVGTLLMSVAAMLADEKADPLVKKLQETAGRAKSLQADVTSVVVFDGKTETFNRRLRLLKPNYGALTSIDPDGKVHQRTLYDGKSILTVFPQRKEYRQRPGPSRANRMFPSLSLPVSTFFDPNMLALQGVNVRYVGKETVEDRTYEAVEVSYQVIPGQLKGYFGASGLVEGVHSPFGTPGRMGTLTVWLKNIRLDTPMQPGDFAFKPPPGFKLER
jgi:outer membrane lipoprotein-sorting protein